MRGAPMAFPRWSPLAHFGFELLHASRRSSARVGVIHTPHGPVHTPAFVPVGTNGAIKFVDSRQADSAGMELMFANTYHLMVHPGAETIQRAGGLHRFMGRDRPIITDSGGFQVFSLAHRGEVLMPGQAEESSHVSRELKSARHPSARLKYSKDFGCAKMVKVDEDGVQLRSYRDGSLISLTPESSVDAQKAIGADIIIPLDELPPHHASPRSLRESLLRTHRWEARSLWRHLQTPQQQAMYAVIHGGTDEGLRKESAELLTSMPFDGWAIGGSLGKDRGQLQKLLRYLMPLLPADRPTHLLGIADDESIPEAVLTGVDTFDSCWPTRLGRHGTLLTRAGHLKINKSIYRDDYNPVDEACDGYVSRNYSRAYLHHLWKSHEPLVHGLLTLHNIKFMTDMCTSLRNKILRDEI